MIRYQLKCSADHSFDSWFQSAEGFDKLRAAGLVSCTTCGSTEVSKALMAPSVKGDNITAPLSKSDTPAEKAIAAMRTKVEENSDYVGESFASEARAMHLGDAPERAIYGEAKPEEARALIEDGVPVLPLPFSPRKRAN